MWFRVSKYVAPSGALPEDCTVVSTADDGVSVSIEKKKTTVDGVVARDQDVVSAAGSAIIGPLVEHTAEKPNQNVSALVVYGDESSGSSQARLGALSSPRPAGAAAPTQRARQLTRGPQLTAPTGLTPPLCLRP